LLLNHFNRARLSYRFNLIIWGINRQSVGSKVQRSKAQRLPAAGQWLLAAGYWPAARGKKPVARTLEALNPELLKNKKLFLLQYGCDNRKIIMTERLAIGLWLLAAC